MKILLLGGTGAIGAHLTSALSKSDAEVYVTTRSIRPDTVNVRYIHGNAKDLLFLKKLMNDRYDAVVDFMNYTEDEFSERLPLLLESTGCYYFLSSSRVYAGAQMPITEISPLLLDTATDGEYLASNEYGLAKAKEEIILRKSEYHNWIIFRPYIIYSESRFQLGALEKEDWLYRVLHGKNIILQESLLQRKTTLTYSVDAAEVMSSIILKNELQTKTFNIVGSLKCQATWGEVLNVYRDILEKKLNRKISVSLLSDSQSKRLRKGKAYYQTSYDRMFDRIFDNTSIETFKTSDSYLTIQEGLERTLDAFLRNPKFTFVNFAQEALIDRFTGEISNVLKIRGVKNKLIYVFYRFIKSY